MNENVLDHLVEQLKQAKFTAQAIEPRTRSIAIVITKIEEAILWTRDAIEKGGL